MKKLCWMLMAILLLLGGCKGNEKVGKTEALTGVERVQSVLGGKERFTTADEAFVEANFDAGSLAFHTVLFENDGAYGEIGVFSAKDGKAVALEEAVRAYLAREAEAIRSLASLYPADELEARLSCYEKAIVGREGQLVYYFALPLEQAQRAFSAFFAK